jgi:mono/diheme cytochrome c family protein
VLLLAACGGGSGEQEDPAPDADALRQARADSVQMAEAEFDPTAFDTISWATPEERLERGTVVWDFSCRKCHGNEGLGDGELARVEELTMPMITDADWEYAGDVPAIRRRIYIGHETEMPSWGLYGLKYRDIDAVAHHIEDVMRAEP